MSKKQTSAPHVLPETRELAMKFIAEGKQMKAISLVRKATGIDWKSAKEYADALKVEFLAERIPADIAARTRSMVAEGKPRAAAVQLVQATGISLLDAKLYVDALKAGRIPASGDADDKPLSERVKAFIAAGDRASAVALVRSETGMDAEEAERFISALG
jgi:ribosomal protein L7/L12